MIKGRIEAYVHENKDGSDAPLSPLASTGDSGLRHASYFGVWGPGSMWGLSNVLLGGFSEVRTPVSSVILSIKPPVSKSKNFNDDILSPSART